MPGDDVAVALELLASAGPVAVEYTVEIGVAPEGYREAMASVGRDPGDPTVTRYTGTVDYRLRRATFECDDETVYRVEGYRTWLHELGEPVRTPPNGDIVWFPNVIWILDLLADPEDVTADGGRLRLAISDGPMRRRPGVTWLGRWLRPPAMTLTCEVDGAGRIASVTGAYQVVRFALTLGYDER
ncbi:MAG: hypothetical protein LT070_13500 [Solirubrobacteraceae bacterium]|nr:hypothetical protein [Solirubrobacteraceae bacterium]